MRPSDNSILNKNGKLKYSIRIKIHLWNFNTMQIELDDQTCEQLIVRTDTVQRFEIFQNIINDASRRHIPKRRATQQSSKDQQWCQADHWREAISLRSKKKKRQ